MHAFYWQSGNFLYRNSWYHVYNIQSRHHFITAIWTVTILIQMLQLQWMERLEQKQWTFKEEELWSPNSPMKRKKRASFFWSREITRKRSPFCLGRQETYLSCNLILYSVSDVYIICWRQSLFYRIIVLNDSNKAGGTTFLPLNKE